MSEEIGFFGRLGSSLTPTGYASIRSLDMSSALRYLAMLSLLCLLLKAVFALPLAIGILDSLQNAPSKMGAFSIQSVFQTKEAILIPSDNPLVQIDSTPGTKRKAPIMITALGIIYGPTDKPNQLIFPGVSALSAEDVSRWVMIGTGLMLPSIIAIVYLGMLLKAIALGALMGTLGYFVVLARHRKPSYSSVMGMAFSSMTIMLLIESAIVPLRLSEWLFPAFSFLGMTFYLVTSGLAMTLYCIWIVIVSSEKYTYS